MDPIILTLAITEEIRTFFSFSNMFDCLEGIVQIYGMSQDDNVEIDGDNRNFSSDDVFAYIDGLLGIRCYEYNIPKKSYECYERDVIKKFLLKLFKIQTKSQFKSTSEIKPIILTCMLQEEQSVCWYLSSMIECCEQLLTFYATSRRNSGEDYNSNIMQISSDELCTFIDSKEDICCYKFDSSVKDYIPHGRDWIKQQLVSIIDGLPMPNVSVSKDKSSTVPSVNNSAQANEVGQAVTIDAINSAVQNMTVSPDHPIVTIAKTDLMCLDAGKKFNDNIIDSYLDYMFYNVIPPELRSRTHIFSCCFNTYLMRTYAGQDPKFDDDYWLSMCSKSAQKWTKNVDLFSKDFLVIPVNKRNHWDVAVVCFISETQKSEKSKELPEEKCSENSLVGERTGHPYLEKGKSMILIFDSYRPIGEKISDEFVKNLSSFLKVLWFSKTSTEFSTSDLPLYIPFVPQQRNDFDCGLFLTQFVESFFKTPLDLKSPPMHLENWFGDSHLNGKREEIRRVLSSRVHQMNEDSDDSSDCDIIAL